MKQGSPGSEIEMTIFRDRVIYHETGHAIILNHLGYSVTKIEITTTGRTIDGETQHRGEKTLNANPEHVVMVCRAGREAEKVKYGNHIPVISEKDIQKMKDLVDAETGAEIELDCISRIHTVLDKTRHLSEALAERLRINPTLEEKEISEILNPGDGK